MLSINHVLLKLNDDYNPWYMRLRLPKGEYISKPTIQKSISETETEVVEPMTAKEARAKGLSIDESVADECILNIKYKKRKADVYEWEENRLIRRYKPRISTKVADHRVEFVYAIYHHHEILSKFKFKINDKTYTLKSIINDELNYYQENKITGRPIKAIVFLDQNEYGEIIATDALLVGEPPTSMIRTYEEEKRYTHVKSDNKISKHDLYVRTPEGQKYILSLNLSMLKMGKYHDLVLYFGNNIELIKNK